MPVESSSPIVTSNRKEVLRCFTVLGEWQPDPGTLAGGVGTVAASVRVRLCLGLPVAPWASAPSMPLLSGFAVLAAQSRDRSLLSACSPAACFSPERLLAFLLPKLDTSNERTRVGSLQVLRHIINSAGERAKQYLRSGG